jgi:small conductance mechanosensitive channel
MVPEISNIEKLVSKLTELSFQFVPRLLGAAILLFLGWKFTNIFLNILNKRSTKRNIDGTLSHFVIDLLGWAMRIILIISAAAILGVETTSFLTVLGTAGLAIGLALQGTLANVAGGLLILLIKPFKVGDLVETKEHTGYVKSITLFVTEIVTFQNEVIIVPNSDLSNGRIKNFSTHDFIRIDMSIGVAYKTDIELARQVLTEMILNEPNVEKSKPPFIAVVDYTDSAIKLTVRAWSTPENYWGLYFILMEKIKKELDKAQIEIPYPQRVVHIVNDGIKIS